MKAEHEAKFTDPAQAILDGDARRRAGDVVQISNANRASDELLPLRRLASLLPAVRGRRCPNHTTLYRWAKIGLNGRSGERVYLGTQFVGGTICSTLADVERFFAATNDVNLPPQIERPMTAREQAAWDARCEATEEKLARQGVRFNRTPVSHTGP